MDKSLIIKEIKKYYNIKSDADLARFIGISTQNIYTWIKRGTYDAATILAKCPELSAEWLLTGNGKMLKNDTPKTIEPSNADNAANITIPREVFDLMTSQQKTIETQQRLIEKLSKKTNVEGVKGAVRMEDID